MSWFSSLADKVQSSLLPTSGSDILNALTLNTAEMTAEREAYAVEARRREVVTDSLSAMLPWETNDEERAILVEECKEAILALSTRKETFFGTAVVGDSGDESSSKATTERVSELLRQEYSSRKTSTTSVGASNLALLPPQLENFNLEAHVGLVRRMFSVDPNLVEMHANLSGILVYSLHFLYYAAFLFSDERRVSKFILLNNKFQYILESCFLFFFFFLFYLKETSVDEEVFWKNYFFNCALTRLEIGLSIDEIWGGKVNFPTTDNQREQSKSTGKSDLFSFLTKRASLNAGKEEEITFDEDSPSIPEAASCSSKSINSGPSPSLPPLLGANTKVPSIGKDIDSSISKPIVLPKDFEIVPNPPSYDELDLDDLDAEIARELEN
jgi:hypothetical protein